MLENIPHGDTHDYLVSNCRSLQVNLHNLIALNPDGSKLANANPAIGLGSQTAQGWRVSGLNRLKYVFTYMLVGCNGIGGAGRTGGPVGYWELEDQELKDDELVCEGSFYYWVTPARGSGYFQIPIVLCGLIGTGKYAIGDGGLSV